MQLIYDVLIIGNGGAGLSAALEANKYSNNIAVVSKTYPTSSQTSQAQGGINAVLDSQDDSVDSHIADTTKAAQNIENSDAIQYLCENASSTIKWLDDLGVPFSRNSQNNIAQRNFGGATHPRTCYSSDYTGLKILHTLYDNCIKKNITFINEHQLLSFIKDDESNTIKGIQVFNISNGEISQIFAKSVIIASGGYAGLYHQFTTNSTATTGEVLNAALNIGCELENIEFVQFHPTSLKYNRILISESARGEGGYLVDQNGNRFIDELKPRDEVSRAIYTKIENGDKVYLDLRHLGIAKIKESMPQEYQIVYDFTGIKLDIDLLEITPSAHYTMGGIKVDINTKTNIKNLFACGECASNRVHGANRLGGNSLLEIITFGKLAGKNASLNTNNITSFDTKKYNKKLHLEEEYINEVYNLPNKINFLNIKLELGKELFTNVGLFREESKLQSILNKINQWILETKDMGISDKSTIYNTEFKEFIEFKNMLELSLVLVLSALNRKESRGAHHRIDYLESKKEFEYSTLITKIDKIIKVQLWK